MQQTFGPAVSGVSRQESVKTHQELVGPAVGRVTRPAPCADDRSGGGLGSLARSR
jgi:hypothetical protein